MALAILSAQSQPASPSALSPEQIALAKAVLTAVRKDDWKTAREQAPRVKSQMFSRILAWMDYSRPTSDASFEEISAFIAANPGWPYELLLRRRAEEAIELQTPPEKVLEWFEKHPAISTDGLVQRAAALLALGRQAEGREAVRKAWVRGSFGKEQEAQFFRTYRSMLTPENHVERLERLLWSDQRWDAERMLPRVDPARRALAQARLALMRQSGGVDAAVARVPQELRNDPGLVYERLRWRRREGMYESARELLRKPPRDLVRPDKWWTERAYLARQALEVGHVTDAGRLAAGHGLEPGRPEFAEAEWLAGWIALRFMKEPKEAFGHFVTMFRHVGYPISRARAGYWSGRAADALGKRELAESWYRVASRHPATFYGQLALARVSPSASLTFPPEPEPTPEERREFERHDLVAALRTMSSLGETEAIRPFFIALTNSGRGPGWLVLSAELATASGRPDLAVQAAKLADRSGHVLLTKGFPTLAAFGLADAGSAELPLVLAVIHQESGFDARAHSPAGARGLMQIMPATGAQLAKRLGKRYSLSALANDPAFNVELGQFYLDSLVQGFGGSYVLALAAYNAGPSRARKWTKDFGDPRDGEVDVVDWIETIPFGETRNYIHRVLENVQVYRQILTESEVALALPRELVR